MGLGGFVNYLGKKKVKDLLHSIQQNKIQVVKELNLKALKP